MFNFDFTAWLRLMFPGYFRKTIRRVPYNKQRVPLLAELLEDRVQPSHLLPNPTVFQPHVDAGMDPIVQEGQAVYGVAPGNNAFGAQTLLQFVDNAGPGDIANLSATITWGDGTTTTGITSSSTQTAFIVNAGGNTFFVQAVAGVANGAHIYEESAPNPNPPPPQLPFGVSVSDSSDAPDTVGASTPINPPNGIADAPLTDTTTPQPAQNGVEGNTFSNVVLATFTDGDQYASASDYSHVVSYTGSPTFVGTPSYAVEPVSSGPGGSNWEVVATSVTFADPGSYTASVSVQDVGGSSIPSTANGPTFTVIEAPLTISAGPGFAATEGAPTGTVTLATFTDGNPSATASDFTATVNWGGALDGAPPSFSVVPVSSSPSGSVFNVVGSATYAEEGTYFASVRVTDTTVLNGYSVDTSIGLNDDGMVVTSPTDAPGVWSPNRFPPAGFVGGLTVHGRPGVVRESISGADFDTGPNNPFDDYQGDQYDLPAGTTFVTLNLYVPSAWSSTNLGNQTDPSDVPSNNGSVASLWGTGLDSGDNVVSFPIIGFNNLGTNASNPTAGTTPGFQVFDQTNGWTNIPGFTGFNQVYQLSFGISNGNLVYFVNGNLVYTDTTPTESVSISNMILMGYNTGASYHINWNPVQDTPATVADAPLSPGTVSAPGGVEGMTPTTLSATFTDANTFAPTSDYSGTIDWGDGVAGPDITSFGPGDVTGSDGSFTVNSSHQYAEEGSYNITVVINDDGGQSTTDSGSATVADAPLTETVTPPSPVAGTEGNAIAGPVLATFTDGNPFATFSDYTPTVTFTGGATFDGTPTYQIVYDGSTPVFGTPSTWEVEATGLTFAEEGTYQAQVTVVDHNASFGPTTDGPTFNIADAPLTDTTTSPGAAQSGYEGESIGTVSSPVVLGTFSDGNPFATAADYTTGTGSISVTWGAGVLQTAAPMPSYSVQEISGGTLGTPSEWEVVATGLVFAEPSPAGSPYTPTIDVTDAGGSATGDFGFPTAFTISDRRAAKPHALQHTEPPPRGRPLPLPAS